MKLSNGNYLRSPGRYSWWLRRGDYFRYMIRELSSLFVGIFSIILIWGLFRLSQGEPAFQAWTASLWQNLWWLSVITFGFAFYHSYTWFMLTPKAMPLRIGAKRVAPSAIIAAHMLLWLVCSIAVWLIYIYGGSV